uniref:Uncharacterized protein n=1 Tax=Daphnia galeata TaxID=27404 RepID=A0A8J2WUS3_9CRUS|nr:unnamed protein product [Daphnia galeata]
MWSTSHRSWIGITAHWLKEGDLTRKSEALCCGRITDGFKDMKLQEFIYLEFDIEDSVESESILNEIDISVGDILNTSMCTEVDKNATAYLKKVIETCRSGAFKKNHDQAFGKLQKLWNLSNRSVKGSELIYEYLDQASLILDMKKLKLEVLDELDLALLKEYLAAMGPLAKY